MAVATPQSSGRLQNMLQASVQSIQWTYSLFWQLCPQQGILIWGDGYYNGAIKTRKTVQPMEVSSEEASLQRSQQLRELYDSLSAGDGNQPAKRPCASLSPEDLTESEWFYLMCVSFSFSPGSGLPGKAFARRQHVWLTGANEVDSKTFSRAILAKSALVQTVFCIPLNDGVIEFGTTEKVHEDLELVKHVKTFFTDHLHRNPQPPPKPALSEHSTSNPVASTDQQLFHYSSPVTAIHSSVHPPITAHVPVNENGDDGDGENDGDDDDDEEEEDEEEEEEPESESVETIRRRSNRLAVTQDLEMDIVGATEAEAKAEASELMQLDMSEDIRLGSPEDVSNNLDSDFNLLPLTESGNPVEEQFRVDSFKAESTRRWSMLQDPLNDGCSLQPPIPSLTDAPQLEEWELTQEDTHYPQTVSTILQTHSTRGWVESSATTGYVSYSSTQSAFAKWITNVSDQHHNNHSPQDRVEGTSQSLLKYILFTVPFLHSKYHAENSPRVSRDATASVSVEASAAAAGRLPKGSSQEELSLSANHVLAERRRREKLNERFVILRSLVPFVTKMDKASILGDTIEYVKQLRKKIQDLEIHNRQMELDHSQRRPMNTITTALKDQLRSSTGRVCGQDKRKMRIVEANNGAAKPNTVVSTGMATATVTSVEVSIIETDALLELQCLYREGLLLDIMQLLREFRIETTAVQSSCNNGVFVAEIRAKVKESINGKKTSIVEVKRGINQIIPQN